MDITTLKNSLPGIVYTQLPDVMSKFGIDDNLKLAHFIGQCDYESGQFTAVSENLNYSAQALLKVFPTHFDGAAAAACALQPEKIANRAYANRMGNGDGSTSDVITAVTRVINGGTNSLPGRIIAFNKYYRLLSPGQPA